MKIGTSRLELIAETVELAVAEASGRASLGKALDAEVPVSWPPEGIDNAMALFALHLHRDPGLAGWLNWYWVLAGPRTSRRTLIGCGGFTSPPVDGAVALGYSLLPALPGKGYAIEAVSALIAWAFSHPEVREIVAETLPDNVRSIRVLQRAGFLRGGQASEPGHIRFFLPRP